MKAGKIIGGVAFAIILIVVAGGYFLLSNLDGIIKGVVEDVGTELTQTKVSLDGVKLDLKSGKGQLTGLIIANPRGFDSNYAFRLDDISIDLDLQSLRGPVIVITEVIIKGAKLNAEQKGEKTNLGVLLKNVEQSSNKMGTEAAEPKDKSDPTDVRLMLEKFVFVDTKGKIIIEHAGEETLKLPDVRRKNIGNKTTGLTPAQLANEILQSVIKQAEKAAKEYLAELAMEAVEKKIEKKLGLDQGDNSKESALKSLLKKKD